MPHDDYTCKYCRYRLDNKVCSHPDSPYIGCVVDIRDWCSEFAFGGQNVVSQALFYGFFNIFFRENNTI